MGLYPRVPDVVDWVESNVHLPALGNANPGPLRLDAWQREVIRGVADTDNEYSALRCASQLGKTEVLKAYIQYRIAADPANIIMAMPVKEDIDYFHKQKLVPTLTATPATRRIFREKQVGRRGDEGMSTVNVSYPGGYMRYINAGVPRAWRGSTAPVLIADELDVFPPGPDARNPVQMLKQRAGSMDDDVVSMVLASTPLAGGFIDSYYEDGSQGQWFVRCEHCGDRFVWGFAEEYAEMGWIPCPHCGCQFEDWEVRAMNSGGEFVHAYPDRRKRSYHISQLASVRKTHRDTLAGYEAASPRGFYTQVLAQSYEDVSETLAPPDPDAIWSDAWPDAAPEIVTAGVDIQKNRLEWTVIGWWRRSTRAYVYRHGVAWFGEGQDARERAWAEMAQGVRQALVVFVDSGYHPDETHAMVRQFLPGKGWWVQGAKTVDDLNHPAGIIINWGHNKTIRLGTQHAKSYIAEMMHRGDVRIWRDGVIREDGWRDYLTQLTSEKLIMSPDGRKEMWQLPVKSRRNEALDCMVYALAASLWMRSPTFKEWDYLDG